MTDRRSRPNRISSSLCALLSGITPLPWQESASNLDRQRSAARLTGSFSAGSSAQSAESAPLGPSSFNALTLCDYRDTHQGPAPRLKVRRHRGCCSAVTS